MIAAAKRSAAEIVRKSPSTAGVLLLLAAAACGGYHVAANQRLDRPITSVAVVPLRNETVTFRVEQILTRALVREFVEKTPYRLVGDPSQADAVVTGAVDRVSASPVIFGRGSFGNTYLVTLVAHLEMRDKAGAVVFENRRFVFRERYVLNEDVENFFSELNPALERIARDFAGSVVSAILEDF